VVELFCVFLQALIHGLNRHYYSIGINYRKNELEQKVILMICVFLNCILVSYTMHVHGITNIVWLWLSLKTLLQSYLLF